MKRKASIQVGDQVQFLFGIRTATGIVKEDRGPIGIKGRNLYLIHFSGGECVPEPFPIELPAEQLTVVSKEDAATNRDH